MARTSRGSQYKPVSLVSIIIVVKNDRGIAATLDALEKQQAAVEREIIVVDSSEPSVLADIREAHSSVHWDQFPVSNRRTTPEQRNRGMELARGDAIVFIDANCVPVAGWLEAMVASLNAGEAIVCGPVRDLSASNLVHYAPELQEGKYVAECTTINVGLRHEVTEAIGTFDTTFSFGQDVDFFWRAADAGYKFYYDPRVSIGHDWGKANEQLRRAYDYGKARAHLFKKHWRTRHGQLLHEPHVWIYPVFILGLPLTFFFPLYPLLLFVPVIKNRSANPFGLVLHHLAFGWGVLVGACKKWPIDEACQPAGRKQYSAPVATGLGLS